MRRLTAFSLLLVLFNLVLSACAPVVPVTASTPTAAPTSTPAPVATATAAGPRLRIRNAGERDINNLVVLFPNSRISFGDVPAGTTTEYQPAPAGVYNYAAFEYEKDGQTTMQPVIDWMGESPRPGQDFTYVITYDPTQTTMLAIQLMEVIQE